MRLSADPWPEFKARVTACYQAPSRPIARQLAAGIRADYANVLPSALACFEDDFEACIAHLRLPVTHRRFARTTNLHRDRGVGSTKRRQTVMTMSCELELFLGGPYDLPGCAASADP